MPKPSLSSQIDILLADAKADILNGTVKTASSSPKPSDLSGSDAKALASIAALIRKEASWEPSYKDLEEFVGGFYGKR
jgi:hypothetical protein